MRKLPKYRAVKTVVDGITFDSKKEARRFQELKFRQMAGEISELEIKPAFAIDVNGMKICKYVADFRYVENGLVVVEDVKGMKTPVYNLKKKLVRAVHGITIFET